MDITDDLGGGSRLRGPERIVEARERLILEYRPKALAIARQYRRRGVEWDDLRQAAELGLIRAADEYRPGSGSFAGYCEPWIRKYLDEEVVAASPVRLPVRLERAARRARNARSVLEAIDGREPSIEDIAATAGLDVDTAREALAFGRSPHNIERFGLVRIEADDRADEIAAAVGRLDGPDREVLVRYFGLDGDAAIGLVEIADELGITRHQAHGRWLRGLHKLAPHIGA